MSLSFQMDFIELRGRRLTLFLKNNAGRPVSPISVTIQPLGGMPRSLKILSPFIDSGEEKPLARFDLRRNSYVISIGTDVGGIKGLARVEGAEVSFKEDVTVLQRKYEGVDLAEMLFGPFQRVSQA